jgi:hypothetical protein
MTDGPPAVEGGLGQPTAARLPVPPARDPVLNGVHE